MVRRSHVTTVITPPPQTRTNSITTSVISRPNLNGTNGVAGAGWGARTTALSSSGSSRRGGGGGRGGGGAGGGGGQRVAPGTAGPGAPVPPLQRPPRGRFAPV